MHSLIVWLILLELDVLAKCFLPIGMLSRVTFYRHAYVVLFPHTDVQQCCMCLMSHRLIELPLKVGKPCSAVALSLQNMMCQM